MARRLRHQARSDSLSQQTVVQSSGRPKLRFALRVVSDDTSAANQDALALRLNGLAVRTFKPARSGPTYAVQSVGLTPYRGRTVTIGWTSTEDEGNPTTFLIDDISVTR